MDKMSEQKYYVKLEFSSTYLHVGSVFISWDKNKKSCGGYCQTEFTKSELAKIMDGALYHVSDDKCDYCRYSSDTCGDEHCEEWINPLIELVPVEDDE